MLLKLAQKFSEMHSEAFHSSHLEYLLQLSFVTPIKALKQLKLTKPCYTSFFYDLRHCFLKPQLMLEGQRQSLFSLISDAK